MALHGFVGSLKKASSGKGAGRLVLSPKAADRGLGDWSEGQGIWEGAAGPNETARGVSICYFTDRDVCFGSWKHDLTKAPTSAALNARWR